MHNWNDKVDIHFLHFFDMRSNCLECWQANIKVDIIKMPLIKGIQLRDRKQNK